MYETASRQLLLTTVYSIFPPLWSSRHNFHFPDHVKYLWVFETPKQGGWPWLSYVKKWSGPWIWETFPKTAKQLTFARWPVLQSTNWWHVLSILDIAWKSYWAATARVLRHSKLSMAVWLFSEIQIQRLSPDWTEEQLCPEFAWIDNEFSKNINGCGLSVQTQAESAIATQKIKIWSSKAKNEWYSFLTHGFRNIFWRQTG